MAGDEVSSGSSRGPTFQWKQLQYVALEVQSKGGGVNSAEKAWACLESMYLRPSNANKSAQQLGGLVVLVTTAVRKGTRR
ncbi:hypothetical protein CLOP_g10208 [Closterium sp. NIES-67]|nr:hypothetical protein CLOP_g10208 [Closterium sp. NIES-67]